MQNKKLQDFEIEALHRIRIKTMTLQKRIEDKDGRTLIREKAEEIKAELDNLVNQYI